MSLQVLETSPYPKLDPFIKNAAAFFRKYLRTNVEGLHNVPHKGPLIIIPNHSGIAGLDAVILLHILNKRGYGQTKVLAHWAYFKLFDWLKDFAQHWGLCETSIANAVDILKENHCLIIFPEGESGNFKPSKEMYKLRKFHTGAMRIALQTNATIIPAAVIGAEESHINLATLDLNWLKKNLQVPIPLNFFPLPAKWNIRFGTPFDYHSLEAQHAEEKELVKASTRRLRLTLQKMINEDLSQRKFVYSPVVDEALARLKKLFIK